MCDQIDWVILASKSVCSSLRQRDNCSTLSGLSQSIRPFTLISVSFNCLSTLSIIIITNQMQKDRICESHHLPIILVCISEKCPSRLLCPRCADSHRKHDLVSMDCFKKSILPKLQTNRDNPDRSLIISKLQNCKEEMLNMLFSHQNKLIALLGQCQNKIEQYFATLFFSLAADPLPTIIDRFQHHFNDHTVTDLLGQIKQTQKIVLGNKNETSTLIYTQMEIYQQKMHSLSQAYTIQTTNLLQFLSNLSLSKPENWIPGFSRNRIHKSYLQVTDGSLSVQRHNGNGYFPLCTTASPFSPINPRVAFVINKSPNNTAVAVGACLQNVVKQHNFMNCNGFGKGVYAIDQNNTYNYSENKPLAVWNHHDNHYSQAHLGASADQVGWKFKEGEVVIVEIDYYNNHVCFSKEVENDSDDEDGFYYQMPVKLDQGPIYPFVSLATKDAIVSLRDLCEE